MSAVETTAQDTIDLRDPLGGEEVVESVRQRRRRQRYGTGTVIDAVVAMVFGLLLAGVLNIHQVVDAVKARDDLPAHDQLISALEPIEQVIETALLDQPRKLLDRLAED